MILPIGALLRKVDRKALIGAALVTLVVAGLVVQVVGVAVCPATVGVLKQRHLESNENFRFVPRLSDLAINWQVLRSTLHRLSTGRSLPFAYEPLYAKGRDPATPARCVFDLCCYKGFRIWSVSMLTASHFAQALGQPPPEVAALGVKAGRLFIVSDLGYWQWPASLSGAVAEYTTDAANSPNPSPIVCRVRLARPAPPIPGRLVFTSQSCLASRS